MSKRKVLGSPDGIDLPAGWRRHTSKRKNGKLDVCYYNAENQKFRSRVKLQRHFGESYSLKDFAYEKGRFIPGPNPNLLTSQQQQQNLVTTTCTGLDPTQKIGTSRKSSNRPVTVEDHDVSWTPSSSLSEPIEKAGTRKIFLRNRRSATVVVEREVSSHSSSMSEPIEKAETSKKSPRKYLCATVGKSYDSSEVATISTNHSIEHSNTAAVDPRVAPGNRNLTTVEDVVQDVSKVFPSMIDGERVNEMMIKRPKFFDPINKTMKIINSTKQPRRPKTRDQYEEMLKKREEIAGKLKAKLNI